MIPSEYLVLVGVIQKDQPDLSKSRGTSIASLVKAAYDNDPKSI